MADFDHFVVTRFSAVFTDEHPPPDPAWLRYRLAFFVEACRASMSRQSGSPEFRWLVFFDDRCDAEFRADVDELAEGVFEPIWTHEVFWAGILPREIAARSTAPFLITTRLDSDDAVATDFIAAVQREFAGQERLFVNFPRGLQVVRSGALYQRDYPSGPFLSLIEARSEQPPLTVFGSRGHTKARRLGPIREVMAPPMWLQVVHGSNIANEVRGMRVSPRQANARFDIDLDYAHRVSGVELAAGRLKQAGRGALRWLRHPRAALEWMRGATDRIRGTHTKPGIRPLA